MKPDKDSKHFYPIYNEKGKASFFLDRDETHVYAWDGTPVAFIEKGEVVNFKGEHLGWHDEGWFRDSSGKCVAFSEPGKSGPNPPKTRPPEDPPADKKEPPEKPEIKDTPPRPPRKAVWSQIKDTEFFKSK